MGEHRLSLVEARSRVKKSDVGAPTAHWDLGRPLPGSAIPDIGLLLLAL